MYIFTPPSSEVEHSQIKICYLIEDRTLDPLNQRQTCYHLSQRGEQQTEVMRGIKTETSTYMSPWLLYHCGECLSAL